MTTAVDTNVLVGLWDRDPALNSAARAALDRGLQAGRLVVSGPVFAELLALPGRTDTFLDSFLQQAALSVEWDLNERIWRLAGHAFQDYAVRRRRQRGSEPRRILADFLIGAHAVVRGYKLLTFDRRLLRTAFPALEFAPV